MAPRRVLHIITELALGGAQRSVVQLVAQLDRRRFLPTLISADGLLAPAARQIPDLPVVVLPSLRRAIHPAADCAAFRQLVAFIRRGRFDIVHTHSSKAGILGRWAAHLAKTPVILHTIHGFAFHSFQPPGVRWAYQGLERLTARITDGLIAVSARDREAGLRAGIGRPAQYRLIRYGIERAPFGVPGARPAVRRALGLAPDQPVIGTVACLKPQKAPLDFVRACALIRRQIPGAQFLLVGDGALRPRVERLRRHLGLDDSLHLLGWREDVPRLLGAMDVFVLASRWEGLPIACLEAMASGLPIVATQAGGIPEVVAHGRNGLLVPVAQPVRLAESVARLWKDTNLARRMGEQNRQTLDDTFTVERMVAQTEQFYDELLQEAHSTCSALR